MKISLVGENQENQERIKGSDSLIFFGRSLIGFRSAVSPMSARCHGAIQLLCYSLLESLTTQNPSFVGSFSSNKVLVSDLAITHHPLPLSLSLDCKI